jgi:hypothetical protein
MSVFEVIGMLSTGIVVFAVVAFGVLWLLAEAMSDR